MRSPKTTQIVKEARKWNPTHQKADSLYIQIKPLLNLKTIELNSSSFSLKQKIPKSPVEIRSPHKHQSAQLN